MTSEEALELARRVHAGQVSKDGAPYVEHVARVAARARQLAPSPIAELCAMAGALHDIVEDTPMTLEELREAGAPEEVIRAVASLTHVEGEPYADAVARAAADPIGRWVKLADHIDNTDEARLGELDPATAERLRAKYAAVRPTLLEATGLTEADLGGARSTHHR